jgi:hypothetical protein
VESHICQNRADMGHPSFAREPEADPRGAQFMSGVLTQTFEGEGPRVRRLGLAIIPRPGHNNEVLFTHFRMLGEKLWT